MKYLYYSLNTHSSIFRTLFLLAFMLVPVLVFAQPNSQEGMQKKVQNFTSFTSREQKNLEAWRKFNDPADYDHPEFGFLPKDAPCESCVEVLSKREVDKRYFVDINDPSKFYQQSAVGDLNALLNGDWVTIDHSLWAVSENVFESKFAIEQAGFNLSENRAYIKTTSGLVSFNNWSLFTVTDGIETSYGQANWSNYTVGDDGVYVTNIFPGIDAEMIVFRGAIKTNFVLKQNLLGTFDELVFRDQFESALNPSVQFSAGIEEDGIGELSVVSGVDEILHIGEAILFARNGPKELVQSGTYRLAGNAMNIVVPFDWINANIGNYELIIDPIVTGTATLAQASITGSRYNGSCNFTNSCDYTLPVPTPANATITDVAWTFTYTANGSTCWLQDGGIRIGVGSCVSPSMAGYYWFCNAIGGGTCSGTNQTIYSDVSSCMPAPTCASQNLTFTLKFYRSCWGATGCGNACIGAGSPWTMTLTGQTLNYTNVANPITLSATTVCTGGAITASTTGQYGVPGYTYNWSFSPTGTPSLGTSSSISVTFPTAGSITLYSIVTDACGNQVTSSRVITVTPGPTITVNSPTYCTGGSATLTASGGTTYTWSPATGLSATTGASVTANPAGTTVYTVTGTSSGCSGTATSTVTVTPNPTIAVNSPTICAGGSTTLTATGGTTYTWSPATGLSATTGASVTANPAVTTVYTVTGTTSGCSGTATSTVTVNPNPVVTVNSPTICEGTSTTLTASGASTYTWSPGTGLSATTGASVTANPTTTTVYTVTGTTTGCSGTATSTVTVNPNPVVAVNSETICAGGSTTLTATGASSYTWSPATGLSATTGSSVTANPSVTTVYTITGTTLGCTGTATSTVTIGPNPTVTVNSETICAGASVTLTAAGATTYTWSPATGLSATTGTSVTASPAATTVYTVTGTTTGCSATATSTVTVNPIPVVTVADATICAGGSTTLTATGATTYTWSPATGLSATTGSSVTANPAATTVYTIDGTTSGCTGTTTATVTVNPNPVVTVNSPTICAGTSATLTATGATTYSWSPAGGLSATTGASVTANPAATTVYTVTGTTTGCTGTATSTVTVNPNPVVTVNSPTICAGASTTLMANGATTYSWSPAGGLSSTTGASVTANPAATTVYTVTGTTSGCTGTATSTVTVNPVPTVTAANNGPLCPADQLDLTANGTAGATYIWNGPAGFNSTSQNPSVPAITAANAGVYTVQISLNGCTNTATTTLAMNSGASTAINAAGPFCANDNAVILTAASPGGTWSGTGIVNPATGSFDPGAALIGGNTITYSLAGSCGGASTTTITVNPLPVVAFSANVASGCAPLAVTFTDNSAPAGTNVNWDFANGSTSSSTGTANAVFTAAGCYDVTLTSTTNLGCSNSTTMNDIVCVLAEPDAAFTVDHQQAYISNPTFQFLNQSTNAATYQWFFDDGISSTALSPGHTYAEEAGNYEVILVAYNVAGCSDTTRLTIKVTEDLLFFIPNSFTPDGNEFNQTFQPVFTSGFDPFSFSLQVYNRWGETMFETHNAAIGWDGTYNGTVAPEGNYTWTVRFRDSESDAKYEKAGSLLLIR